MPLLSLQIHLTKGEPTVISVPT